MIIRSVPKGNLIQFECVGPCPESSQPDDLKTKSLVALDWPKGARNMFGIVEPRYVTTDIE